MSIFKSTINPTIAAQLKAREKTILSDVRNDDFLRYTTGKNSWVRMVSFVDYTSKIFNSTTGKLENDRKYSGDFLSRKYVLEGGTLYDRGNNNFSLRSGVGKLDGVYASNIDKIDQNPNSSKVDRLYGLRPMPGITSVNIISKNAYGSLREATVQFLAWDKHQLEELEILFMRTGYTVLLEWGWSQYIDHDVPTSVNNYPNLKGVQNFDGKTINPFEPKLTEDTIYNRIEKDIIKYKGNYDALLGYIKNFSWQLMPNGGFQCSTTLISRGEIIETLKASANTNIILGSTTPSTTSTILDTQKPVLSNFEKIFLNIAAKINESEWVTNFNFGSGDSITGSFYVSGSNTDDQKALRDQSDIIYGDINSRLSRGIFTYVKGSWDNYTIDYNGLTGLKLDNSCVLKFCDGKTQGTGIEYININTFIAIINEFFLIKNKKDNRPVVTIVLPYNTPCLASEDSVSIDPTTCIIKNTKATLVTNQTGGFNPDLFINTDIASLTPGALSTRANIPEFLATTSIGQIGNIFISMSKIIQIYRNLSGGPDGVDVLTLLQDILDACSFALGGINDFKLYTNRNIIQIIDIKYLENSSKDSKFKFDLIGLKSICRDVKINSRIFAEQSTMIGIAAGASGDQFNNLGDIYSSTQTYFNRGLTDRIISATYDDSSSTSTITFGSTTVSGSDAYYVNIFRNIESLVNYINRNVTGASNLLGPSNWQVTVVPQENEVINAGSLLKTFHYQINSKDVDFKALIPFELEITLDGIGGFIIGQVFTIDKSILPRDYYNKNLGFVITGINHSLQNNDWITNIRTQICLLDNDKIKDINFIDKEKLRKFIQQARVEQAANGYLFCAIADLMVNQYNYITSEFNEYKNKQTLERDFNLITKIFPTGVNAFIDNNHGSSPKDVGNVIRHILDFPVGRGAFNGDTSYVENYLRNWWQIAYNKYGPAGDNSAPNFPDTYEKFITPKTGAAPDGAKLYEEIKYFLLGRDHTLSIDQTEKEINSISNNITNLKSAYSKTFFGQVENLIGVGTFPIKTNEKLIPIGNKTAPTLSTRNTVLWSKLDPTLKTEGMSMTDTSLFRGFTTRGDFTGTRNKNIPFNASRTRTADYTFPSDSFNLIFCTFYSAIVKAAENGALFPGLSAYGAPPIGADANFKNASFRVVRFESPQ